MVDVWAVIGEANSHKTSTIRALTGVHKVESSWLVGFQNQQLRMYVHPPGLQEVRVSPQDFIATIMGGNYQNVIVALRYLATRRFPDASTYMREFQRAGWLIVGYAVLGQHQALPGFQNGTPIAAAPITPSNVVAAQLRGAWGIL